MAVHALTKNGHFTGLYGEIPTKTVVHRKGTGENNSVFSWHGERMVTLLTLSDTSLISMS